ncbi:MAG: SPOR domain-containing protein [Terriglobales bacterium]
MKPAAQRYESEPQRKNPPYQLEMGTKSLLAAFCALAIVCGLFFAFGYTIGKHAIPSTFTLGGVQALPARHPTAAAPPAPGVAPPNPTQLGAAENNAVPATLTPPPATGVQPPAAAAAAATANAKGGGTLRSFSGAEPPAAKPSAKTAAKPAPKPPAASPSSAPAATDAAAGSNTGSGLIEVQVFAGTSPDAAGLANALQTRGYPASVVAPTPGTGNNLYRVEVGPYLTRSEADAMRSRLRADGYQAVLKFASGEQQ